MGGGGGGVSLLCVFFKFIYLSVAIVTIVGIVKLQFLMASKVFSLAKATLSVMQ